MLGVGGRRRWEAGNAGRWWEAEGVLEKVGETEKIVSKERCKYTVNQKINKHIEWTNF